LLYFYYLLKRS